MMSLLLLLLACTPSGNGDPAPATPAAPAPTPATGADGHEAGGHGAPGHGHGAAHGGELAELDGLHVEAKAMAGGVMFWVTDGDARPLAPESVTGTAVVQGPAGVEQVTLAPMADHLHAVAALELGKPARVVVTITRDGRAQSATFDIPAVGLSSHDHTSLHGGQVGMWGDFHVEYLGRDGVHQFWVTDAERRVVSLPLRGTVTDGGAVLPLTVDAPTGRLSVSAAGAGTRPVSVDIDAGGTAFTLAFNASP